MVRIKRSVHSKKSKKKILKNFKNAGNKVDIEKRKELLKKLNDIISFYEKPNIKKAEQFLKIQ